MTMMSMIVAGSVFAQETTRRNNGVSTFTTSSVGNVTTLLCDLAYVDPELSISPVFYKDVDNITIWNLPYEGGDGGKILPDSEQYYQTLSYGVEGLWLSTNNETLEIGNGFVDLLIAGTATSSGTAYFNITFAGKSCVLSVPVY